HHGLRDHPLGRSEQPRAVSRYPRLHIVQHHNADFLAYLVHDWITVSGSHWRPILTEPSLRGRTDAYCSSLNPVATIELVHHGSVGSRCGHHFFWTANIRIYSDSCHLSSRLY